MWLLALLLSLMAESPAGEPDRAKLEQFLRRYYAWPVDMVDVKIGAFMPAPVSGFRLARVQATAKAGKGQVSQQFWVSDDGRYIFQSQPLVADQDPFAETKALIDLKDQPAFGSVLPKVTVVEYSDLQCSYCRAIANTIRQDIPKDFGGEVRIIFKDFPLTSIHNWAMDAHIAGRCIYKQDADTFWLFHDWIFEQQEQISVRNFRDKLKEFTAGKKINGQKLNACMAGPEARAEVEAAVKEGESLEITGTPVLFINGRKLVGAQPYSTIKQIIQAELEYARGPFPK
jgi:protein-disulfide isomerase